MSKRSHRRKTRIVGNRQWRRHRHTDWKGGVKR